MEKIHDPQYLKLGKAAAVHPPGMRMLAELGHSLPEPPPAVAWYKGASVIATPSPGLPNKNLVWVPPITSWNMDGNDRYGDCCYAAAAHMVQLWTAFSPNPYAPTTEQVLDEYSKGTGFNPKDPSTDNGAIESDMLDCWRRYGIFERKIDGFVGINPRSQTQIKDAIWFFGCALLGIALPKSAQDQTVWDVPPEGLKGMGYPGSWGGHAVPIIGAGRRGVTLVTWGATKQATWEFIAAYTDEAYAALSPDWITNGHTPGGVPMESIVRDLAVINKQ